MNGFAAVLALVASAASDADGGLFEQSVTNVPKGETLRFLGRQLPEIPQAGNW